MRFIAFAIAVGITIGTAIYITSSPMVPANAPVVEHKMQRLTFTCDTDTECANLPPCKLKAGCDGSPATEPYRLVGYDCVGASGPLYHDEEDEFPVCGEIKALWE